MAVHNNDAKAQNNNYWDHNLQRKNRKYLRAAEGYARHERTRGGYAA